MGSQSAGKVAAVAACALLAMGLGAWQAWDYFKPHEVSDPAPRHDPSAGGPRAAGKSHSATASTDALPPDSQVPSPEPSVPTQFVSVPAQPQSAQVIEEFKPLILKAVAANAEIGQSTNASRNALVNAAMASLSKMLGIGGTLQDAMLPRDLPAGAKVETRGGPGGPALSGMADLLKDASVDPSRAEVEYFPEGPGMGPPKPKNRAAGGGFNATMRMMTRGPEGEKKPQVEVRIPVKIKNSPGPGDDLEIGVMLEQAEGGEAWTSAGFNLHIKKPEVLQKVMGSGAARSGRSAPVPAASPAAGPEK